RLSFRAKRGICSGGRLGGRSLVASLLGMTGGGHPLLGMTGGGHPLLGMTGGGRALLRMRSLGPALLGLGIVAAGLPMAAQPFDPLLLTGMRWRLVGPFRGGRVLAATGVPGEPNRFYFGAVGGGVWRTD